MSLAGLPDCLKIEVLRGAAVSIGDACKTVRQWAALFAPDASNRTTPGNLVDAVAAIKGYLEHEKGDGKPIHELVIAEHLLTTRVGVRWVMPFVLSAESIEAAKRRNAQG